MATEAIADTGCCKEQNGLAATAAEIEEGAKLWPSPKKENDVTTGGTKNLSPVYNAFQEPLFQNRRRICGNRTFVGYESN